MTKSMRNAIDETNRRRAIQQAYNEEHGITPKTVKREVTKSIVNIQEMIAAASKTGKKKKKDAALKASATDTTKRIIELEQLMKDAAEKLDFETAIALRQEWLNLKNK